MNTDDTFKNTDNNNHTPAGLTSELEVRVVAWLLGEATPAEAAELARLAAENSALADFKRRIETVHGWVGAAARPVGDATMRLSEERRAKVLAVIGHEARATSDERTEARGAATPRWVLAWNKWALPMAACITLCVLLGAVVIGPEIGFTKKPKRPDPSSTVMGWSGSAIAPIVPTDMQFEESPPVVAFKLDASERDQSGKRETAVRGIVNRDDASRPAATMPAPTAAPASMAQNGAGTWAVAPTENGLTKSGAGTLTLNGGNIYTGSTVVSGGVLELGDEGIAGKSSGRRENRRAGQEQPLLSDGEMDPFASSGPAAAAVTDGKYFLSDVAKEAPQKANKPMEPVFGVAEAKKGVGKNQWAQSGAGVGGSGLGIAGTAVRSREQNEGSLTFGGVAGAGQIQDANGKLLADADAPGDKGYFDKGRAVDAIKPKASKAPSNKGIALDPEPRPLTPPPVTLSSTSSATLSYNFKTTADDAKVSRKPAEPAFDESLRLETATNQQAISTFSLHVSDASFRIAKAALARGEAPEAASIRPEEFYNAFDYGDPSAVAGEPVACRIEQSAHPFLQQRNLVRIAMKVPATGRGAGQPLRLTVLLDTSGSMEREDRAAGVRAALTSLVSLLGADDRITLIGFARQPHLLADRVPGNQAAGLADLVAKTPFEGGTNLEEALKLAGNLARGQFTASAQNRIVLLTDGAANLGNDDPAQLAEMIGALRQQGIAFDACGVGADGLDDTILEALTRKGDGRYTVINSPEEADAGFAHKLAGAFRPAAENVKVQVRFNPSRVVHYRLIGFEQHRLKTEDFRNDRVDAAELAAEEAAVALYQVEVSPDGEGELGEVFVRFRDAATGNMVERSWTLAYVPQPPAFVRATPSMKLAGTAAFLAEKLRGGDLAAQIRLDELAPVVNALRSDYAHDARVKDLVTMFAQTRRLTGN